MACARTSGAPCDRLYSTLFAIGVFWVSGCNVATDRARWDSPAETDGSMGGEASAGTMDGEASASEASSGASASDTGSTGGISTTGNGTATGDSAGTATDGVPPTCEAAEIPTTIPTCSDHGRHAFGTPTVEWSLWAGLIDGPPLVANLTDDNGDGAIDLCDSPDVIVPVMRSEVQCETYSVPGGELWMLDGASGSVHAKLKSPHFGGSPAIGDIDGDAMPEIVGFTTHQIECCGQPSFCPSDPGRLVAFNHDFTPLWEGPMLPGYARSVALADLDNDGDVEIMAGHLVADHQGNHLWSWPEGVGQDDIVAVDLDGDGDLEVVLGNVALHHDGSVYYNASQGVPPGIPHVAELDGDDDPEIIVAGETGISILQHDGAPIVVEMSPVGPPAQAGHWWAPGWGRPAAVADYDGDGKVEIAATRGDVFTVFEADGTLLYSYFVSVDATHHTEATHQLVSVGAFDFDASGRAAAAVDGRGEDLIVGPGGSVIAEFDSHYQWPSGRAHPVVADVDNDGSAELLLTGGDSDLWSGGPTLSVVGSDHWAPARRIWNQESYHVTNVNEDGTIPQFELPHWQAFGTYRVQAHVDDGIVCRP